jgi:hypothetical protein
VACGSFASTLSTESDGPQPDTSGNFLSGRPPLKVTGHFDLGEKGNGPAGLEDYCRRLAKEGHTLYIACGPAGIGGEGKNGRAQEVGKGRLPVTVPKQLWKVIVVLPREDAEPRRNTRVIATIFPNDQSVGYDWSRYRVSTRAVEKLSGCRFFSTLPEELADALRDHVDEVEIPAARPRRESTREKE